MKGVMKRLSKGKKTGSASDDGSAQIAGSTSRESALPPSPTPPTYNGPKGKLSADGKSATFRVAVPPGINPGDDFEVYAGNQIVGVKCPANCRSGHFIHITVPIEKEQVKEQVQQEVQQALPPISDSVSSEGGAPAHTGSDGKPKDRIARPPPPDNTFTKPESTEDGQHDEQTQLFEVVVPDGAVGGRSFSLLAGDVRVLVACPLNAKPGQRIRFKLPLALTQKREPVNDVAKIKLSYDKDGWTRQIRVSDMKFQWVRMDDHGNVDNNIRFDPERSAYVRKLDVAPKVLSLVPATEAFVNSRVKGNNGEVIVMYSEIAEAQVKAFADKAAWFQEKCKLLQVEWEQGHMRINVRRENLIEDSVDAVMSLNRRDLRKLWRFEFMGELGIDAGGLAREWFELVTQGIFNPDVGLWSSSEANQMCMQINPASKYLCEDYLVYYRFLGRVMGRALFDGQLVNGHMVQYLYKHVLGWPIMFKDMNSIDEEYYNNLKQLQSLHDNGEDLEMLCLNFTTYQDVMGVKEPVDLIPGGEEIDVTNDNFPEYLEACLRHRMMDRVRDQLNELLLGFFDVIPEPLLTVFDFQELELLMCGLPEIDMEDWRMHTEYSGYYEHSHGDYPVCHWFWEVVEQFDQETKARLLQFVTGTSGVPSRGFGVLQGNDGSIRKFTIHGVRVSECLYPRAHTCFNRLDLPIYETKKELRENLKLAVTMASTGFDLE